VLSCRRARRALEARSDERLGLERGFELEAHLEGCPACRGYAASLERLDEALAGLSDPPLQRLDVEASVRAVRARLEAEAITAAAGPRATGRRPLRLAGALAAAALVVLLGYLATREDEGGPEEGLVQETRTEPEARPTPGPREELAPTEPREAEVAVEGRDDDQPSDDQPSDDQHRDDGTTGDDSMEEGPIDEDRLRSTRDEVARLLLEAAGGLADDSPPERVEAFAQLFDLNSLSLRRAQWPVRRLVERLLEAPDPRVGRAAARYLGLRGDRLSRSRLEQALERPELARAATLALRDAGPGGVDGLGRALHLADERDLALASLGQTGGPEAARVLAAAAADTDLALERGALLATLAGLGPAAVEPLLELGDAGHLATAELLERVGSIEGAGDRLLAGLEQRERRGRRELRLRCAAELAPLRTARWLEDRVHERELRTLVRRLLPRVPGVPAVASLLRLAEDTRLSSEDLVAMTDSALEHDAGRFAEHARVLLQGGDQAGTTRLAELLVAVDSPLRLAGLRALLPARHLPAPLDRDLVALIGAGGDAADVEPLLERFAELGEDERHLAASCLVALQSLGGQEAVERALDGVRGRTHSNILGLLRRRPAGSGTPPSLYKLARELKPFLSERAQDSWRSEP